jgi:hypothetical protein
MNELMKAVVPAIIAVFGVGFGAWLNHVSSRDLSLQESLAQYSNSAYRDFIRNQFLDYDGDLDKLDTEKELQLDTVHRIAVFSPAEVVEAVADFLRHTGREVGRCEGDKKLRRDIAIERLRRDITMHQAMRRAVHNDEPSEEVDDHTIAMVLFGCDWTY